MVRALRMTPVVALLAALLAPGCRRQKPPAQPTSSAQTAPVGPPLAEYTCEKLDGPITIDGELGDEAWQPIPWTDEFGLWNAQPARTRTKAKLAWDDDNLYLAFECQDRDIEGTMKQRDDNLWLEDEVVELFADAGDDQQEYLEFEVNPLGTQVDLIIPYRGRARTLQGSKNWDSKGWRVAVKTEGTIANPTDVDTGWTCEMAVPLTDFLDAPHQPPEPGDVWRINLYRVDKDGQKAEFQAWSPTMTEKPSFHEPERFGKLVFAGPPAVEEAPTEGTNEDE